MVLEFSVGNFRSIKEIQTISFVASPIVSKYKEVDENNTFRATDKIRLLKSLAVYGANASGKSNFIKAFTLFMNIINTSVKNETVLNNIESFAFSDETINQPTYFQILFILNNITYRYGFEATKKEVVAEWLFSKNYTKSNRESSIFKREYQELDINEKNFKSIRKFRNLIDSTNPIFRKNTLFIATLAAFNEDLSKNIADYFSNNIQVLFGLSHKLLRETVDNLMASDLELQDEVLAMLQESDTSIEAIHIIDSSKLKNGELLSKYNNIYSGGDQKLILTFHSKNSKSINSKPTILFFDAHASEGTKKMYEIYPFILLAIRDGGIIVIDEFDARFHPRLSQKIIDLFNNPKTNPKNAQLLVVTHDTNLLSAKTFRRDQILFVEKDKNEASRIYSLAEFKGVRNDASFEKDYLDGRYGAVPILNNFSTIFEN